MCRRIRRRIGTWLGVAALLCQILLPFGVAQLADATVPDALAPATQSEHYHDPGLANSPTPETCQPAESGSTSPT